MTDQDAQDTEVRPTLGEYEPPRWDVAARYALEVRQYGRLSDDENRALARRIQAGEARNAPLRDQNLEIRRRNKTIQQANHMIAMFNTHGDRPFLRGAAKVTRELHPLVPEVDQYQFTDHEAIDLMVRGNLDYALRLAFQCKMQSDRMPFMDMVSAANDGLLDAVRKFNPDREHCAFAAYAYWPIRGAILNHIARHRDVVAAPPEIRRWRRQIHDKRTQLGQVLHRKPTTVELANAMGINVIRLYAVQAGLMDMYELDAPLGESGDRLAYTMIEEPAETAEPGWDGRLDATRGALAALQSQQAKIVAMYYGLDPESPPQGMTFWEICLDLNIPETRVERLFGIAMERLREEQADELRPVFEEWVEGVA